ncbi:MAG: hypothetical protein L0H29_02435, partial [Sinobacteraceae bacterium]|nr:hypothetical protein [Nevskiaceae bacterium]
MPKTPDARQAGRLALRPLILLGIVLVLTTLVYSRGVGGGWLFDDFPNIVDNPALELHDLTLADLTRAALSSPSSRFKRPLASLSFAFNEYFSGRPDPQAMKLTNIVIHLLNGVVLYCLVLALLGALGSRGPPLLGRDPHWTALLVTAAWLLLPINLTGVLYVVQRMTSLANLFVLLGLLGYVHYRRRMQAGRHGLIGAAASLVVATGIGFTAKETAVMAPLYALLIEWLVFGFSRGFSWSLGRHEQTRRIQVRILVLFFVVLALPLAAGLWWEIPQVFNPATWTTRDFTLHQRLLSEAHAVADYVRWTLLPTPDALSFYHDAYPVSTGWLQPVQTLVGGVFLLAMAIVGVAVRKRAPLVALGIGLFLAPQLLTGTILPLELVYEHRNYFASFGLLLAVVPLLSAPGVAALSRRVLLAALLLWWVGLTAFTAVAWNSPLSLARTLAERAPQSPRAQYGLGREYIILSRYDPASPYTKLAYAPLERAMRLPGSSILPEQALIMMNSNMHLPLKATWWDAIDKSLRAHKPGVQDVTSMAALTDCAVKGNCKLPQDRMVQAFLAGLSHPGPSARLLAAYANYAWNVMRDNALGLRMAKATVE